MLVFSKIYLNIIYKHTHKMEHRKAGGATQSGTKSLRTKGANDINPSQGQEKVKWCFSD